MRNKQINLHRRNIIYLKELDNNRKQHPVALFFARKSTEETGIFAINFREHESNFLLALSSLVAHETNFTSIWIIENLDDEENNSNNKVEYFFLRELTQGGGITRKIGPYQNVCFRFAIVPFSQ